MASRQGKTLTFGRRAAYCAFAVVRFMLVFLLTFGMVLYAQSVQARGAYAASQDNGAVLIAQTDDDDEPLEGPADPEPEPEPESEPEPEPEPEPELYIDDVAVFETGTKKPAYAFATSDGWTEDCVIGERGGQIDFDGAIYWNNGEVEYDSGIVDWELGAGGEDLASLSPTGILEARGTEDGFVIVRAVVSGDYTESGSDLVAEFAVELRGQTDTPYVTYIQICDEGGNPIDSYRFEPGTLSTASVDLGAIVSVFNPADGSETDYHVTPYESLSNLTNGEIADLNWDTTDSRFGLVSEEGVYRPLLAGTNSVFAYSGAGFNGSRVEASVVVDMPLSGDEEPPNGYNPQNTLTVDVVYEAAPDTVVAEKTYSIGELEELGTVIQTYTAIGGTQGYFTTTGYGPYLSTVLQDVGVNIEGVAGLGFETADNYQKTPSWDALVDTARYYFPNIDVGSYSDRVQVAPMLAISAYRNVGDDTSPHTDVGEMTDRYRFMVLFGAKDTGETNTNKQVYNIYAIHVTLEGAPSVDPGTLVNVKFVDSITGEVIYQTKAEDPKNVNAPEAPKHEGYTFKGWSESTEPDGTVVYTAVYESDSDDNPPNPSDGSGDSGNENGGDKPSNGQEAAENGNNGGGTVDLVARDASSSNGQNAANAANGTAGDKASQQSSQRQEPAITQLNPNEVKSVNKGKFSVLQEINRHPSNVADLMLDNPFAPYAGPTAAGVFVAGGMESFVRFRRQKRLPDLFKKDA